MSAFLQLLWAPRNVQVTPVERTALRPGEQLALNEAGRSFGAEAELRITGQRYAPVHGRVSFRDGAWRLTHVPIDAFTFVNGTPQTTAQLQHLDVLEPPYAGPVFRFLLAAIGEGKPSDVALDDPGRLAVWADELLEANDPLGDRIARCLRDGAANAEDDLRSLGPLARTLIDGRLEVEWKHGLLRRAVLRDLQLSGREPLSSLDVLLRLPVARFIEELVVDAGGAQSNAAAYVDVLRHVGGPRSLKAISFGDCSFADGWVDEAAARLGKQLAAVFPALGPAPLFGKFRRATLVADRTNEVQELGETLELIETAPQTSQAPGPVGIAFWRLQRQYAHWELEGVPAGSAGIVLNGRPVGRTTLRDGDRFELSTGAAYRFRLER